MIGIRRGWEGLTHVNLEDPASRARYVLPLSRENTRTVDRTGGTFLHSSRTNPSKMKKLPEFLEGRFPKSEFTKKGITSTVFDVTSHVLEEHRAASTRLPGRHRRRRHPQLRRELDRLGFKVIAVPKTMDNDVRNTEYCIGFSTAITRAMDAIERQRTTVGSHERIGIFRVFGRDAGYTALYTAYVTSIRCGIPEYKFDLDKLIDLLVTDKKNNPSNYSLVILSEGAEWEGYTVKEYGEPDAFGHRKKMCVARGPSARAKAAARTKRPIVSDLTYDLRGGNPDFVDRWSRHVRRHGRSTRSRGQERTDDRVQHGCFTHGRIPDPKLGPRHVDVETMYNTDRYRPNYTNKQGFPVFLTRA